MHFEEVFLSEDLSFCWVGITRNGFALTILIRSASGSVTSHSCDLPQAYVTRNIISKVQHLGRYLSHQKDSEAPCPAPKRKTTFFLRQLKWMFQKWPWIGDDLCHVFILLLVLTYQKRWKRSCWTTKFNQETKAPSFFLRLKIHLEFHPFIFWGYDLVESPMMGARWAQPRKDALVKACWKGPMHWASGRVYLYRQCWC